MKNFNLKTLMFCCVASVFFVGCGDPNYICKRTNCGPNGTCWEGWCECKKEYEGKFCDTLCSSKFIGHWKGKELIIAYDESVWRYLFDTIPINWQIETTDSIGNLKIKMANGAATQSKLNKNELTINNEIYLDSLHTITRGFVNIDKVKDTIRYKIYYKSIGKVGYSPAYGILYKE